MTPIVLHWAKRAVYADLARGGGGLLLSLAGTFSSEPLSIAHLACVGFSVLFASYLAHGAIKLAGHVTIDDFGVQVTRPPLPEKRMAWKDTSGFEVRHFTLGQFRKKSLVDLKLTSASGSILLDDGLQNFQQAVQACCNAAQAQGIGVSESTRLNLAAAGCDNAGPYRHG